MGELVSKLGIDWKLLIAQIINFLVLLAILYKFLYQPLLNLMRKRQEKIEKSLEDAKKIEENMVKMEKMKEDKVLEARKESQRIIEEVQKSANKNKEELAVEAQKQAKEIIDKAKVEVKEAKSQMLQEAKKELADLVIASTEKVVKKTINQEDQKKLVDDTIKEVVHQK